MIHVAFRSLVLLVILIISPGCGMTHSYPTKAFYALPSLDLEPQAMTLPMMLTIPRAYVAPPFGSRALQYRVSETLYEPAYYQQWASDPGSLVSAAVSRSLASTGGFIVLADGTTPGVPVLRLTVTELYADVRNSQSPRAVLAVQVALLDEHGNVMLVRDARSELTARSDQPSDIIDAWASGLGRITGSLVPDLVALQSPARPGGNGSNHGTG